MLIDKNWNVKPEDYSDLSQADILAMIGQGRLLWTESTSWMYYNGTVWVSGSQYAQQLAQDVTRLQKEKAATEVMEKSKRVAELNVKRIEDGKNEQLKEEWEQALKEKQKAESYLDFSVREKQSSKIKAAMTETIPQVAIDIKELDKDPFLLNCPGGTVDLRTGEMKPHNYRDHCTHCTLSDPGSKGLNQWLEFLEQVTSGDISLQYYLQTAFGKAAIGRVYSEGLTILFGEGGNGKSTLTNAVKSVLGDYAVQVSPQLLITTNQDKSSQMEIFRGARLVLTSELEYGMQLDSATVKRLTSTDDIFCNPKFKKPYSFTPTHSLFLSTNYLPRVANQDKGTWDRLTVVPFTATFRGQQGEQKNYAQTLVDNCSPAIMQWVIDGARAYINAGFKLDPPEVVQKATEEYHNQNDWLTVFISLCCETGSQFSIQSSKLYGAYKDYCSATGAFPESNRAFSLALQARGFRTTRTNSGVFFIGLHLAAAPLPDTAAPTEQDNTAADSSSNSSIGWDDFI